MQAIPSLVVLAIAIVGLTGCQPDDSRDVLAGYESPDPLVLRTPTTAVPLPEVTLEGVDGEIDSEALFAGHWTLLYVGYSFCPDICPTELGQLSRILPALAERRPDIDWQVVFLSVDPARDTPERLASYTAFFSPAFVPVTGSRDAIDRLTGTVKAGYRIQPHQPGDLAYSVDHDVSFRLIDPKGRMLALLPPPHDPQAIVNALDAFLSEVKP